MAKCRPVPFAVVVALAMSSLPAEAKDDRLVLKQMHRIYGNVDVIVTKDAVKVSSPTTDYAFVCQAPKWESVLYSDKRKIVSRRPYQDWSSKGIRTALSIMDNQALYKWPRTLVAKKKFKGIDSALYAFPYRYENGYPADLKFGKFGEYAVTDGVPVNKHICTYLQALFDTPPAEGIPLRMTKYGQGNSFGLGLKYNQVEEVVVVLDTISTKWDNQTFTFSDAGLKSYKAVAESDVVVKNQDMSDVYKTLMVDDPDIDKKSKKKK